MREFALAHHVEVLTIFFIFMVGVDILFGRIIEAWKEVRLAQIAALSPPRHDDDDDEEDEEEGEEAPEGEEG